MRKIFILSMIVAVLMCVSVVCASTPPRIEALHSNTNIVEEVKEANLIDEAVEAIGDAISIVYKSEPIPIRRIFSHKPICVGNEVPQYSETDIGNGMIISDYIGETVKITQKKTAYENRSDFYTIRKIGSKTTYSGFVVGVVEL